AGALKAAAPLLKVGKNPYLVHVGAGIAALGERREDALTKLLPDGVRYVGVGVGKRWNRAFMKVAADRSGGHFTQINPDEPIAWRAFDLLATLNTPRLQEVRVVDDAERVVFLSDAASLTQGEELCAIARFNVDRGRKDRWAMYACAEKIPIVYEPQGTPATPAAVEPGTKRSVGDVLATLVVRVPPRFLTTASKQGQPAVQAVTALHMY